jgi:hypothetical protein
LTSFVEANRARRVRLEGHVARRGSTEIDKGIWQGNQKERGYFGDIDIDGKMTLNVALKK